MLRKTLTIAGVTLLVAQTALAGSVRLSDFMDVLGSVTDASRPVESALVVAFNLVSYDHSTTRTDRLGSFHLDALPAGIYRIIAVKPGFVPAVATVVPNRRDHRVALRLAKERRLSADEAEEIWAIRRALPADVLRELDMVMAPPPVEGPDAVRFSGEMISLAGMSNDPSGGDYTETAVGFRGELGSGWSVDLQGQLRVVGDDPLGGGSRTPDAESSGMKMALHSSSDDSYEIATTRSHWLDPAQIAEGAADIESHSLAWRRASSEVAVRYLSHENVFTRRGYDSETLEVEGQKTFNPFPNYGIGVRVRLGQVTPLGGEEAVYRVVDLSSEAIQRLGRNIDLSYGFRSRQSGYGSAWAPETTARIGVGSRAAFVVSGMYKVYGDDSAAERLPSLVFIDERSDYYPKYRCSAGWVLEGSDDSELSLMASMVEVDSPLRVVFKDHFNDVWDGYDLDEGDVARDVTLRMHKVIGNRLAIDLATTAGRADNDPEQLSRPKTYVSGALQSYYRPSGTSLDIAYRYVGQALDVDSLSENERFLFRMGQSLRLPLDVRVLLGFDLARMVATRFNEEAGLESAEILQTRLVGGVSVGF